MTFDIFSSSVTLIEGYDYVAVITDDCTEYLEIYALKTKDEMFDVAEQCYAEMADLRQKCQLFVVMRDNAGENVSKKINAFFQPSPNQFKGFVDMGVSSLVSLQFL